MAVVDASVYVALIHENEPGHEASWDWLATVQARRETLRSPNILAAEVSSAVSRGTGNRELAHQIVRQLLTSNVVELTPVSPQLAGRAAVIAADHQLRGCDAVYVALAEMEGDVLITLDRQQLERGAAVAETQVPPPSGTDARQPSR